MTYEIYFGRNMNRMHRLNPQVYGMIIRYENRVDTSISQYGKFIERGTCIILKPVLSNVQNSYLIFLPWVLYTGPFSF